MTATGKNRIMILGPKDDGTYVVEFRTAEGEALAISIPRSETAVIRHFQERMPYEQIVQSSTVPRPLSRAAEQSMPPAQSVPIRASRGRPVYLAREAKFDEICGSRVGDRDDSEALSHQHSGCRARVGVCASAYRAQNSAADLIPGGVSARLRGLLLRAGSF
jgi:hypothetical protein